MVVEMEGMSDVKPFRSNNIYQTSTVLTGPGACIPRGGSGYSFLKELAAGPGMTLPPAARVKTSPGLDLPAALTNCQL